MIEIDDEADVDEESDLSGLSKSELIARLRKATLASTAPGSTPNIGNSKSHPDTSEDEESSSSSDDSSSSSSSSSSVESVGGEDGAGSG